MRWGGGAERRQPILTLLWHAGESITISTLGISASVPSGPSDRRQVPTGRAWRNSETSTTGLNPAMRSSTHVLTTSSVFVDRVAADIGSTSAALRDRSEQSNAGWFDTRADNHFWFTYGQLYAYYGILKAAHADFADIIQSRQLENVWTTMETQLRDTLNLEPVIVSNGREDGWIMPSHLATVGFYLLRVRSNLVEIRSILDR